MLKNKDYRRLIRLGAAFTLLLSAAGCFLFGITAGLLILAAGVALIGLFAHYTRKRYQALENLNSYLTGVLAGEESPPLSDQEEGELSILKTNIYKTSTTLIHQKELLKADKTALASAIADISHQLKTPLTSMMVMNDLLTSEEDPEKRKVFLATQSAQLDRMNWLIQTLLKLSKLDAGVVAMNPEDISAKDLIAAAVRPFEIQMELKDIALVISGDDMILSCDRNWTIEALQNIIKNCFEHMTSGGRLTIETKDTHLFWQIMVSDTGCGIAKEDLPHIFERFYKGKNAGKDSVGIGLALSKTILENQHGDILVNSEEGAGTQFDIRLYKTII